ncbi:nuclease-related domain-containing DEAD/DEAH box helicase [Desulfurobacterium atlanticum]|uniref:nuclease-related domain-containing DEAD/DEAH box helicase n=1 Tax=Desulfurobacterium atlanticum TaxID=240169 RepID=UPI0015DB456C|nr:NERD domain-containing protein/DEAD/DEAH box helicase [Desulfurobacterium atlanticum]
MKKVGEKMPRGAEYRISKGEKGEYKVAEAIRRHLFLREKEENFILLVRTAIGDISSSREIDVLLIHPVLGIYVVEVKDWKSLDHFEKDNPYPSVRKKRDLIMAMIEDELGRVPINVEFRIVFPSTTSQEAEALFKSKKFYRNYRNHIFFKDEIENPKAFSMFFNSTVGYVPKYEDFLKISELLAPPKEYSEKNIVTIIGKEQIFFFDHKQLSALNGYTGDFLIVRGVAGTGKTALLINFVLNRYKANPRKKFLVLCFNAKLRDYLKEEISASIGKLPKNIYIYSLMGLLKRIEFDFSKLGVKRGRIDEKLNSLYNQEKKAIEEFRKKFRRFLLKNRIDYFLCDETQDMPPGLMRVIYEEIKNCIFFVDEAQCFYEFSMQSIEEIFSDKYGKRIEITTEKERNLRNVYRTPSNICECALKILSRDSSINEYYKNIHYLSRDLLSDLNLLLEEGDLVVDDLRDLEKIGNIVSKLPRNEKVLILSYESNRVKEISDFISSKFPNDPNIEVATLQSIKGLEAPYVIIDSFGKFLLGRYVDQDPLFYRKIYVLLTRASKTVWLSIDNSDELLKYKELKEVFNILQEYALRESKKQEQTSKKEGERRKRIPKLKPNFLVLKEVLEGADAAINVATAMLRLLSSAMGIAG